MNEHIAGTTTDLKVYPHLDRANREFWEPGGTPVYENGIARWYVVQQATDAAKPLVDRLRLIVDRAHLDYGGDVDTLKEAIEALEALSP